MAFNTVRAEKKGEMRSSGLVYLKPGEKRNLCGEGKKKIIFETSSLLLGRKTRWIIIVRDRGGGKNLPPLPAKEEKKEDFLE